MFNKITTKKDKRSYLEQEIEALLIEMSYVKRGSKEYTAMAKDLEVLYKAQSHKKDRSIDLNTVALVGCNLVIALTVLWFEKSDTITSKVTGYLFKGRV